VVELQAWYVALAWLVYRSARRAMAAGVQEPEAAVA